MSVPEFINLMFVISSYLRQYSTFSLDDEKEINESLEQVVKGLTQLDEFIKACQKKYLGLIHLTDVANLSLY
jgi:hypothetical protein